jgi:hypothetical protein
MLNLKKIDRRLQLKVSRKIANKSHNGSRRSKNDLIVKNVEWINRWTRLSVLSSNSRRDWQLWSLSIRIKESLFREIMLRKYF